MSLPISGFMPIPLAIMPPFMAYQSLVMGDAFGRAFQFGKRKISAMGNEEFNKLDIVTMFETISNEYTRMIPTVEKSMSASTELQVAIVKEMLKIIPALGQMLIKGVFGEDTGEHILHGYIFGHQEPTPPRPPQQPPRFTPPIPPPTAPPFVPPPVQPPRHPQETVTVRNVKYTQAELFAQTVGIFNSLQGMLKQLRDLSHGSDRYNEQLKAIQARNLWYLDLIKAAKAKGWKIPSK